LRNKLVINCETVLHLAVIKIPKLLQFTNETAYLTLHPYRAIPTHLFQQMLVPTALRTCVKCALTLKSQYLQFLSTPAIIFQQISSY